MAPTTKYVRTPRFNLGQPKKRFILHPSIKSRGPSPPVTAKAITYNPSAIADYTTTIASIQALDPERCMFLELPREMRDEIYGFLYPTEVSEEEVELYHEAPPFKALCFANKQLYEETHEMHNKAFRAFYQQSNFLIELNDQAAFTAAWAFTSKQATTINHINHLRITFDRGTYSVVLPNVSHTFILRAGGQSWEYDLAEGRHLLHGEFVVGLEQHSQAYEVGDSDLRSRVRGHPLTGAALLAEEAWLRQSHHLGPAPGLADQLTVVMDFAAMHTLWWFNQYWSKERRPRGH